MTYVRSCIAALLAFCSLLTAAEQKPSYHLSINRKQNALHLVLKKSNDSLIDFTAPYKGASFTTIENNPFIQRTSDTKHLKLTYNEDQHITLNLVISPRLDIDIKEASAAHPCTISLKNAHPQSKIYTNTILTFDKDFTLESPEAGTLHTAQQGKWNIGGKALFSIPKGSLELHGLIETERILAIKACSLNMHHGQYQQVEREPIYQGYNEDCYSFVSQRRHPHAQLRSKQADITIDVIDGQVEGALIVAQNRVTISFQNTFKNLSVKLNNLHCSTEIEDVGIIFEKVVEKIVKEYYDTYDPAVIQAGQAVIVRMGTEESIYDKDHKDGTRKLSRLTNTGKIQGGSLVDISSLSKRGELFNSTPGAVDKRRYTEPVIAFFNDYTTRVATKQARHDDPFIYVYPAGKEEQLRPLNELGLVADSNIKGDEPMLLSPALEAEILFKILADSAALPVIEPSCNNNYHCLLKQLQNSGLWHALVNTKTVTQIEGSKMPKSHITAEQIEERLAAVLSPEDKAYFKDIAKKHAYGSGLLLLGHPDKLYERLQLIMTGYFKAELPEEDYWKSRVPLIYYTTRSINGRLCVVPVLYLPQKTLLESYRAGTIQAHDVLIHDMGTVINKGFITAINKLKIQARHVVNAKNMIKTYSLNVPLPGGDLVGFDVEIEVPKGPITDGALKAGIKNIGGSIFATHRVFLNAQQGDIINKRIPLGNQLLHLDAETVRRIFGNKPHSKEITLYPGRIVSKGTIDIVAHAAAFLNEGSDIYAQKNLTIEALKNIVLKTVAGNPLTRYATDSYGLSIEHLVQEASALERSTITAQEGAISIKSVDGYILDQGTSYVSGTTTTLDAKEGVKLKPATYTTSNTYGWAGCSLFECGSTTTTVKQQHKVSTEFRTGGDVYLKSGKDNILEAVAFHSGGIIHLTAQRDNVLKGTQEHSSITTSGWSFGVSFFGLETAKNLIAGDYPQAAWALNDEDSLLAHLHKLKDTSGWSTVAEGTYTGIDAWKAFLQYCESAKNKGSKARFFAQRLGLTNSAGTFAPQLKFKVGTYSSQQDTHATRKTNVKAQGIAIKSGRDVLLYDGPKIEVETASIEAESFKSTAAEHQQRHTQTSHEASFSGGTIGASISTSTSESSTFENAHLNAKTVTVTTKGDTDLSGINVNAESAAFNIGGHFTIESTQDHSEVDSESASASLGATIGASASFHEEVHEQVPHISGINSEHLNLTVAGTARIIGAFINARNGTLAADKVEHENIINTSTEEGLSLGAFVTAGDTSGIPGSFEIGIPDKQQQDMIRATVAGGIDIKAHNDISDLNRKVDQIREVLNQKDDSIRIVLPILDWDRFQESAQKVKAMFASDKPLSGAGFDNLVESMDIREPNKEEKEQMHNIVETLGQEQREQKVTEQTPVEETPSENNVQEPILEEENKNTENEVPQQSKEETENYSYAKFECEIGNQQRLQAEIITSQAEQLDQSSQSVNIPNPSFVGPLDTTKFIHIDIDPYQGIVTVTRKGVTTAVKLRANIDTFQNLAEHFQTLSDRYHTSMPHVSLPDVSTTVVEGMQNSAIADFWNKHKETILEGTSLFIGVLPFIGSGKAALDALLGKDIVTGEKLSLSERVLIGGVLFVPGFKIARRMLSYGGKEALSFARVGGRIGLIAEKKGVQKATTTLTKNAGKIEQTVVKNREVILERVKTFEQARNRALEILGDLGHDARPAIGKFGALKGKIVGRESSKRKAVWRLDYDSIKGPHINVKDFRQGKAIEIAIPFEGDSQAVNNLLRHLNR